MLCKPLSVRCLKRFAASHKDAEMLAVLVSSVTVVSTGCGIGLLAGAQRFSTPWQQQMKNPDRLAVTRLEQLPNIGKAMAADLRLIGIERPQQLIGCDPLVLFRTLEEQARQRHDPCVLDTFMAAIHFMESGEALPWWSFTAQRKCLYRQIIPAQAEIEGGPQAK